MVGRQGLLGGGVSREAVHALPIALDGQTGRGVGLRAVPAQFPGVRSRIWTNERSDGSELSVRVWQRPPARWKPTFDGRCSLLLGSDSGREQS